MSLNSLGASNGHTNSRMTHSLSTPSGVDGSTSSSHSRGGKKLAVRVQMLDDSMTMFQVQVRAIKFNYAISSRALQKASF
jgi:FERM, RhoGEF and pleckstrin domain protein 2